MSSKSAPNPLQQAVRRERRTNVIGIHRPELSATGLDIRARAVCSYW